MELDDVDRRIIALLQDNARIANAEIGRDVELSAPAVSQRIRRLEEAGVILGYHARVDPEKLGYPLRAIIRLRPNHDEDFAEMARKDPQILTVHRVTGEDCYVAEVIAPSMASLEALLDRSVSYGSVVTSVVLSTAIDHRPIEPL